MQLEDGSMAYIHHTPKGGPAAVMAGGERRQNWPGAGSQHRAIFPETQLCLPKSSLACLPWGRAQEQQPLP